MPNYTDRDAPPKVTPPQIDSVPAALSNLSCWVLWRYDWVEKDGEKAHWAKVPYHPRGYKAAVNKPATWSSFDDVVRAYKTGDYSGIGFVFSPDAGICGVDLDGCLTEEEGEHVLTDFAKSAMARLPTYCEISPSGNGLHFFALAQTDDHKALKNPEIEIYFKDRFFTFTGICWDDQTGVEDCTDAILSLRDEALTRRKSKAKEREAQEPREYTEHSIPADELLQKAFNAANGAAIQRLYCGDTSGYASSENDGHSEADLALCNYLAFWCQGNSALLDQWFRASALMRPKWDERRGAQTYGEMTIEKAINGCSSTYNPNFKREEPEAETKTATSPPSQSSGNVQIDLFYESDLAHMSNVCWRALQSANDPPYMFQRDGQALRLEQDHDELHLRKFTPEKVRYEFARIVKWLHKGKQSVAPLYVAADMLAANPLPLPYINRIVRVPVFSANGKLKTEPGYDSGSENYLAFANHYGSHSVSPNPSDEEIREAKSLILDDVLIDFPFVSNADRANAVALMLLPFVREMIDGPTPCHLIDSSANGSGKTLLAECLLFPSQHRFPGNVSEIGSNEEVEKSLFAMLIAREPIIFLDNINARVSSGILANYITAETKSGRLLGQSVTIQVPVRCVWVATGANIELSNENARRCLYIRLVPDVENPEGRTTFKHTFLKEWIVNHSAKLAWAAHTIIQRWIAKGKPPPSTPPIGSFERWHFVIGGILQEAGISDFLGNQEALTKNANVERTAWTEFVDHWRTIEHGREMTVKDLCEIAEMFEGIPLKGNTEKSRQTSLGILLAKQRDKYFTAQRLSIVKGLRSKEGQHWKLQGQDDV